MHSHYSNMTLSDFAAIFDTSVDDIPDPCRKVIKNSDFRYSIVSGAEREAVFLRILNTLNSDSLKVSGPQRKQDWEKGWSENLQNFRANKYDLSQLIPRFVKQKEIIRFQGDYIVPVDPNFETNFKTFINFLLNKRPSICINVETVYELHDKNSLFDYLATVFLEKRNYLRGYLDYLKQLDKNGEIDILETRKTIGGLYHEAYAYTVWKPKP